MGEAALPAPILSLPLGSRLQEAGRGEERLGTFLFPQTMPLSPRQAPAGLLQRLGPVAGCCASLVDSLVLMQAAGRRRGQGSGAQPGML